jgi:hypothetical protein
MNAFSSGFEKLSLSDRDSLLQNEKISQLQPSLTVGIKMGSNLAVDAPSLNDIKARATSLRKDAESLQIATKKTHGEARNEVDPILCTKSALK